MTFPVLLDDVKRKAIWKRMATTERANLIGLWLMAEASGGTSIDSSPQGNDGAYTDVTLGQPGYADGRTSALFNGSSAFNNIYSVGLRDDFDGEAGTLVLGGKVSGAGVWTDGDTRKLAYLGGDGDNFVGLIRGSTNNQLSWQIKMGGTLKGVDKGSVSTVDWFSMAMTWSLIDDEFIAYWGGDQEGSIQTGIGTWSGNLNALTTCLGAINTSAGQPFDGYEAYAGLWTKALTQPQIARMLPAGV